MIQVRFPDLIPQERHGVIKSLRVDELERSAKG
jgi:hypothetical protein